jgi:hypothetical protein
MDIRGQQQPQQRDDPRQYVNPQPFLDERSFSRQASPGHEAGIKRNDRQPLAQLLEAPVQSVREHYVGQLARCVALSAEVFGRLRRGVRELFGAVVDGVWEAGSLRWVVCSACCDYDASGVCEVGEEEVEEESVADVVDFKISKSAGA